MKWFILVLILAIACASSTAPEVPQLTVKDYFPYGNYNEFTIEVEDGSETTTYTGKVTSTSSFQGETVYVVNYYYYSVVIDGEWREYGEMPTEEGEYLTMLKEPLEEGTELNSYSHIDEVGLTLSTPFGTLENCIKVIFPNNGQARYFAPGYGIIKETVDDKIKRLVEVK